MPPFELTNSALSDFLHTEQVMNNHRLYDEDFSREFFHTTVPFDFQPAGQSWFRLPYFLVPVESPWSLTSLDETQKEFLNKSALEENQGQTRYRFFLHPLTVDQFKTWVGDGLEFISAEHSDCWATPTSSYRSLLVFRDQVEEPFIVKASLFTNLTNGSRHIDWHSALGQFEHSQIFQGCVGLDDPVIQLPDVAALGLALSEEVELPDDLMITIGPRKVKNFGTVIRRLPPQVVAGKVGLISIASLTSPERFNLPLVVELSEKAGGSYGDFIQNLFTPLLETLHTWILEKGFLVEPHCQNTLVELDTKGNLTGRFYYRDFDRMHLDRDIFPGNYPELWQEYTTDRPDRLTPEEEQETRLGTLQVYFHHFLKNLCWPLLRAGYVYQKLTKEEMDTLWLSLVEKIKSRLYQEYPDADPDFLLDSLSLEYGPETLGMRNCK